jgi:hypothetical protein
MFWGVKARLVSFLSGSVEKRQKKNKNMLV